MKTGTDNIIQYAHSLVSSALVHTLALWLGILASTLLLGKAGGTAALIGGTAIAVCIPFFIAGYFVGKTGYKYHRINALLGGLITVVGYGVTIALYMDYDLSTLAGGAWILGFSAFSVAGDIFGYHVESNRK